MQAPSDPAATEDGERGTKREEGQDRSTAETQRRLRKARDTGQAGKAEERIREKRRGGGAGRFARLEDSVSGQPLARTSDDSCVRCSVPTD